MSDELNPMARAFLQSVEDADDPTRADYDRVHAKVKTRLAAGIAAGVAALASSKAAAATTATATTTATTVAAGAAAAGAPAAAVATVSTGTAIAVKIAAVFAVVAAVGGGTTAVVRHAQRSQAAAPAPASSALPVATRPTSPPTRPSPVLANPAMPEAPATQEAPATSAIVVAPSAAPRVEAARSTASAPAAPVAPAIAAPAPPSTGSSLEAEIGLLRDARAALRSGDAARSLALLDDHDRRFPGGALGEDCAAERVYALCALGDLDGARRAAARFLADHPFSPHAASVRASCGGTGNN